MDLEQVRSTGIVDRHDEAGRQQPLASFAKLPKASEKFRQAFQIVPKTINFLPIPSANFSGKPSTPNSLRPNLSAGRPNAPLLTLHSAVQGR